MSKVSNIIIIFFKPKCVVVATTDHSSARVFTTKKTHFYGLNVIGMK